MKAEDALIKETDYWRQFTDFKTLWQVLFIGLIGIVAVTVLQDYIHSRLNRYSFILSESLLYKTVWILFLPLLFLQVRVLKARKIEFAFRISLAILLPISIHLFLTPLTIWFVSDVFYSHTYSFYRVLRYTLSEDLYKLLIIYSLSAIVCTYYSNKPNFQSVGLTDGLPIMIQTSSAIEGNVETHFEKIVVSNGRNYVSIATDDILCLTAATPYISIHLENKRYLHSATLKSISEKLDKSCFIRIHKSSIVNLSKVISYQSRLNGDYDLLLENGDKLRLSRNYAEKFKRLFNSGSQVKQ
jgi:two-component system, LytTR family, response regulator